MQGFFWSLLLGIFFNQSLNDCINFICFANHVHTIAALWTVLRAIEILWKAATTKSVKTWLDSNWLIQELWADIALKIISNIFHKLFRLLTLYRNQPLRIYHSLKKFILFRFYFFLYVLLRGLIALILINDFEFEFYIIFLNSWLLKSD